MQRSQEIEREGCNVSADMSISEESADDNLYISKAEVKSAPPAQEEFSIHQEVDVELELSLTGGRLRKIQHGTSTINVVPKPSSADVPPFLSLSISCPPAVRRPRSPHAPFPCQGQDDVVKAGKGGLSLDSGKAMCLQDLESPLVQTESKEASEDVDWDWRERLVRGATAGREKKERLVDSATEGKAQAMDTVIMISEEKESESNDLSGELAVSMPEASFPPLDLHQIHAMDLIEEVQNSIFHKTVAIECSK